MSQYGVARFGQDAPSRIAGVATMFAGAGEILPGEPTYNVLIPFVPPTVSGGGASSSSSTTADGRKLWRSVPARCDLLLYQGDDVVIPLFFADDGSMAEQDTWQWFAQMRVLHSYRSTLVNEFFCRSENVAETVEDEAHVKVEMFLPRDLNCYSGVYRWDLYAIEPEDLSRFDTEVPQTDLLRTWLYGVATIVPRVTSTDVLPPPVETPPEVPVLMEGGWFVGPNGRVP